MTDQYDKSNWLICGYEIDEQHSFHELVGEVIAPLFSGLEGESEVATYHYNINGGIINVRIFPDSERASDIVDQIEEECDISSTPGDWPNRDVDKSQVGEENIKTIDKCREFGSRVAIEAIENDLSDEQLRGLTERGFHVFTNNLRWNMGINLSKS